jgi:hypothetical protein
MKQRRIWVHTDLLGLLSKRYRIQARNDKSTNYLIEDLRNEYYGAFTDSAYFRRCIEELAKRHPNEILVEGDLIKVSRQGILNLQTD